MTERHRLYVTELTSVGLVDSGDNPTADVLIYKHAPDQTPTTGVDGGTLSDQSRVMAPKEKGATVDLNTLPDDVREEVEALQKDRDSHAETVATLETQVAELTKQVEELTAPGDPDPLADADPVVKAQLDAQAAKIAELEKAAADRDAAARLEKAQAQHTDLMLNTATAEDIAELSASAPEAWQRVASEITAKNAVIEKSDLFVEVGRTGDGEPESAATQIDQMAKELRKENPKLSLAQARTQVRDENPDLKAAERKESN